jgi:NADH pyrophosphatase NudC (nudix superfamily)
VKPVAKYCLACGAPLALKEVDGRPRLGCACGFVFWNNPVPVVAGLIGLGDQIVLARNARWPVGLFSMITGFLEAGESPVPALLRETEEELGLVGRSAELIGHYAFPQMNQLILAFFVEAEGQPRASSELAEVKLIERAALDQYDFGPLELTKQVVADWLGRTKTKRAVR